MISPSRRDRVKNRTVAAMLIVPRLDHGPRGDGRPDIMLIGERGQRHVRSGDGEDDQGQQPFDPAHGAVREHRLREHGEDDGGDRRGDERDQHRIGDDADMRFLGRRQLLGEARFRPSVASCAANSTIRTA